MSQSLALWISVGMGALTGVLVPLALFLLSRSNQHARDEREASERRMKDEREARERSDLAIIEQLKDLRGAVEKLTAEISTLSAMRVQQENTASNVVELRERIKDIEKTSRNNALKIEGIQSKVAAFG